MARVVRVGGFVYVNAPSAGFWHGYPDDNYRFYRGAASSLAFWCGKAFGGAPAYPLHVVRQYFEHEPPWLDNVMIFERTRTPAANFTLGRSYDAGDPHEKRQAVDGAVPAQDGVAALAVDSDTSMADMAARVKVAQQAAKGAPHAPHDHPHPHPGGGAGGGGSEGGGAKRLPSHGKAGGAKSHDHEAARGRF